jgi:integrin beta 3
VIDRDGALMVTMTDGTQRNLGLVVGRDGRDGLDGKNGERGPPGFSLDKFDVMKTGDRTIELRFADQAEAFAVELEFPFMIYRGVWTDGQAYTRGDTVTWGGSLYHCDAETTARPGTEAWTLAAKKGRDGKAGDKGDKGEPGKKGDPGVDRRY